MSEQEKCPNCGASYVISPGGWDTSGPMPDKAYPPHMPGTVSCKDEQIKRLKAENERLQAELKDWQDSASVAANESCGDEKHCTCVPLLREENEMLRKIVEKLPELAGEFLREAEDIIRVWHGEEGWDIYREHSPEMTRLIDLAAKIATLGASEAANRSL